MDPVPMSRPDLLAVSQGGHAGYHRQRLVRSTGFRLEQLQPDGDGVASRAPERYTAQLNANT